MSPELKSPGDVADMEEILVQVIKYLIAVILGVVLGNSAVYMFNHMPAAWFCDYGEEPSDELKDPYTQRVKSTPWKYTFSMLFVAAGLYLVRDDWVYALAVLVILWLLLEMSISDIKYRIVPDQLLVLLAVSAAGVIQYRSWQDMLYGAAAGFLIMGMTALLGKALYRRDAVGGGDIKLFSALGLLLGLRGVLFVFMLSALLSGAGLAYLLAKKKIKRTDTVPMVPFIAAAAGIYLLFISQRIDFILSSILNI